MLVLSRKPGESIVINSNIEVTVISIGKGRVKIGISAPDDLRILRSELKKHAPDEVDGTTPSRTHGVIFSG